MSRETIKRERLIARMHDSITEHLHELKASEKNSSFKESDLERWTQSLIKNALGYSATDGYIVTAQESKGKMRPDLVIFKNNSPVVVIEIKKLGFALNKSDFRSGKLQLSEYLKTIGNVRWGILTNGYEWNLYDFSNSTTGIEILSFDIRSENDEIDVSKNSIEDICWTFVDLHKEIMNDGEWNNWTKEAVAFSPESLAQAILTNDCIKYISKVIRGEHDYRVNHEVLLDKVHGLILKGLDDSVVGWNEEKEILLSKHISSQKRLNRKKKNNKHRIKNSTSKSENCCSMQVDCGQENQETNNIESINENETNDKVVI